MTVDIGRKFVGGSAVVLDDSRFVRAAQKPELLDRVNAAVKGARIKLTPYATWRIVSL